MKAANIASRDTMRLARNLVQVRAGVELSFAPSALLAARWQGEHSKSAPSWPRSPLSFPSSTPSVSSRSVAEQGSTWAICQASPRSAIIVSLDLPEGPFGGLPLADEDLRRLESFARPGQSLHLLQGDSGDPFVAAHVKSLIEPLDLLFIDGSHAYEGVSHDYELYGPLVRPGGLIAFHDIVEGPASVVGDVPRFWRQLRTGLDERVKVIEIVADRNQGGYGIGVVRVGDH